MFPCTQTLRRRGAVHSTRTSCSLQSCQDRETCERLLPSLPDYHLTQLLWFSSWYLCSYAFTLKPLRETRSWCVPFRPNPSLFSSTFLVAYSKTKMIENSSEEYVFLHNIPRGKSRHKCLAARTLLRASFKHIFVLPLHFEKQNKTNLSGNRTSPRSKFLIARNSEVLLTGIYFLLRIQMCAQLKHNCRSAHDGQRSHIESHAHTNLSYRHEIHLCTNLLVGNTHCCVYLRC
jgi:hypothetical protein